MRSPIRELMIRHERVADGYSELKVRIDDKGALVMDGADAGKRISEAVGDWDYEYAVNVPAAWKDTVLLHVLKDRFETTSDFMDWLKEIVLELSDLTVKSLQEQQ